MIITIITIDKSHEINANFFLTPGMQILFARSIEQYSTVYEFIYRVCC